MQHLFDMAGYVVEQALEFTPVGFGQRPYGQIDVTVKEAAKPSLLVAPRLREEDKRAALIILIHASDDRSILFERLQDLGHLGTRDVKDLRQFGLIDAFLAREQAQTEGLAVVYASLVQGPNDRLPMQAEHPAEGLERSCRERIHVLKPRPHACRLMFYGFSHHS
jgi:hypothetical protein